MSAHDNASKQSTAICNEMVSRLRERLPGLQHTAGDKWCSFRVVGRNVFAYGLHTKRNQTSSVHFNSVSGRDLSKEDEFFTIIRRPNIRTDWDKQAPWIATISAVNGVNPVIEILLKEAYPLSEKKRKGRIEELAALDIAIPGDSDLEVEEGRKRLVEHLVGERSKNAVLNKKKQVRASGLPLACEVCGFVFADKYREPGADYCEVHHLPPLAGEKQVRKTRNQDLAIVCANCHRVIHRRNPPFTMEEMRQMLIVPGGQ